MQLVKKVQNLLCTCLTFSLQTGKKSFKNDRHNCRHILWYEKNKEKWRTSWPPGRL